MANNLKAKSGNLNLFLGILLFFPLVFPANFKEKRAKYAEKGLDYQILLFLMRGCSSDSLRYRRKLGAAEVVRQVSRDGGISVGSLRALRVQLRSRRRSAIAPSSAFMIRVCFQPVSD